MEGRVTPWKNSQEKVIGFIGGFRISDPGAGGTVRARGLHFWVGKSTRLAPNLKWLFTHQWAMGIINNHSVFWLPETLPSQVGKTGFSDHWITSLTPMQPSSIRTASKTPQPEKAAMGVSTVKIELKNRDTPNVHLAEKTSARRPPMSCVAR